MNEPPTFVLRENAMIRVVPEANPKSYVERVAKLIFYAWWGISICAVALLVLRLLNGEAAFPRDETDSPSKRSSMELLTDYGTGCQYLRSSTGMIARLDAAGRPICKGAGR